MVTWTKVHIAFIAIVSALLFLLCNDTGPVDPNSTKTKEEFQFKGSIAGIVLSDDSIPVSGVAVALDSAGNSTVTDSLGHYRIPNVTAGTYKISFTHPHYFDTSISKNITLTIDEDVIGVAMVIRRNPSYFPGSISGTIFDQDSAPIKGVSVRLDSIGTTTTSDSAGKFTLSNVVPGTHKLTISSANYIDTAFAGISVALQQKVTSAAIILRKNPTFFPGKISGSIIDSATKKGIAGIIVTRIPDGATTSTDSLGLYMFADVPVGSYSLTFTNSDYLTITIDTVKVTMNQTVAVSQKTVVKKTGTITGIVTDKSQLPIDGVAVSTDSGQSAITGTDGVYLLTNVPGGTHTLTFTNSMYQTTKKEGIIFTKGQALTGVDTSLVKLLSSISGTVLDSMKHIPAAEISVTATPGGYTTITGADGTYTIPNVPQGTYTVTFSHVIFLSKSQNDVVLSDGQHLTGLNMSLVKKTGTIAGIVTDKSQLPIAGVAVSTDSGQSAITGIDGVYLLTNVPGGVYKLTFTNSQYQTTQKEGVILTPNQTLTGVDTSLVKLLSSISGTVTDVVTGSGISGVAITSTPRGYTTTTGPGGSYTLPIAVEGTYLLSFSAAQYHDTSRTDMNISAGEFKTGVDIAMNRLKSSISGSVQDSMEHTPAAGISVTVTPGGYSTNTGADGTYTIPNVPQGTYTVTFAYGSYLPKSQNNVVLSDGQNLTGLNMSLVKKTGSIAGTVTDKTNSPIAGVSVSTGSGKSAVTGISGTYLLTDIPGGTHTLTFTNSKYNTAQKEGVLLAPGQALTGVDTSLVKLLSSISGSVTDNSGGAGISGVGVTTTPPSVSTSTAANGAYTLPNVPEGTYILNFTSTIYRDTTLAAVRIVADTFKTDVNIGMQKRLGSVSGTVTDYYTGVPVADELLALVPSGLPTSISTSSGLFTIKDVPSGTYSVKIAATTIYDSLVIPSISVAPGEAVTGIVAKVKKKNTSKTIYGKLLGDVTGVAKIIATLTGDSVPANKPFVDTLVWSSPNYNGTCHMPGIGSYWTVEVRVFNTQSKMIGYTKKAITLQDAQIGPLDFSATNAVPIANAGSDTAVSIKDVIKLHGNAVDSFGITGVKNDMNAKANVVKWEWSINGGSFIQTSTPDTNITAPNLSNLSYKCVLRVTDSDNNVSYPDTCIMRVHTYAPVVTATATEAKVSIKDVIQLHAVATDTIGNIVKWEWDFGNTGTFKQTSTADTAILAPDSPLGSYMCVVRATDDDNNSVTSSVSINVVQDAPAAGIVATSNSVYVSSTITLHASATQDFGSITKWEWKIGAGSWNTRRADTSFISQSTPQALACSLKVTDDDGNIGVATTIVTVTDVPVSITDQPDPLTVNEGQTATMVVSATGTNLQYQWQIYQWGDLATKWKNITEATLASYNITTTKVETHYGIYRCLVSNSVTQDVKSDSVVLRIISIAGITVTDKDDNVYQTVQIGNQIWTTRNLAVTQLNDGISIPNVVDNAAWYDLTTQGYCWYNNESANKATYGALYNWYTVHTGKLAPAGWHVPTETECAALSNYLGGAAVAGGKLKEAGLAHWRTPNTGATNETGFSALPGGSRNNGTGSFNGQVDGFWWCAPENGATAVYYQLYSDIGDLRRYSYSNYYKWGYSVRLVRD